MIAFVTSLDIWSIELHPLLNSFLPLNLRHSRFRTILRVTSAIHLFVLQLLQIQILKQPYIDDLHTFKEARLDTARHAGATASRAEVVRDGV
jgi:hypothetical protein